MRAALPILLGLAACTPREAPVVVELPVVPRDAGPVGAPDSCEERDVVKIGAAPDGSVDRAALDRAMEATRAYAEACCVGGASGTVEVRVEITPSGWQTSVKLTPSSFEEGDTGACLEHSFQMVLVAPFTGPPMVYSLRAHLKGGP
ncbi:MAG TPA: hypothetical protein VF316_06505 [Polyangiaceae bacterium]